MKYYFYDIESLDNVFTLANFKSDENHVDIFYKIDNPDEIIPDDFLAKATQRIYDNNKNFRGTVALYDLNEQANNELLAETFGLSDATYMNDPDNKSSFDKRYRLVCDTDTNYNEDEHPYLLGYNSYHYDTTMLTMYLLDTFQDHKFMPVSAKQMRVYNNELFTDQFKEHMEERLKFDYKDPSNPRKGFTQSNFRSKAATIRKNMMMSGRHLDVARLNEKQSKVGLKRLLGMLGYQILESDKLRPGQDLIENADQLLDLIAYNISDVVNLRKLFEHKTYQSSFTLKKQLLKTYPELVYSEKDGEYEPNISPKTVRNDRLVIDSSSAQFATKSLCPYDHLTDYHVVSFDYPSAAKAKALGIKRVNVLEEAKAFFYKNFPQQELRDKFDEIYNYYKSIEGKNFNESKNYLIDHGIDPNDDNALEFLKDWSEDHLDLQPHKLSAIPAPNTCIFYYKKDGTPSTCFVNFSTGGIHGAECNMELFEADMANYEKEMQAWQAKVDIFNQVMTLYPDPRDIKINKGVEINGVKYKPSDFLKPKATKDEAYYKDLPAQPKKPALFKQSKDGGWNLDKRYTYTSADPTQHEDFTSYYPNMLRMMDAFFNTGLGYDRYGEIFDDKTKFGKMMKDEKYSKAERELYSVMRNGTKLILNSASGAGDASFESNIRMNNKIISMRIVGQLFTWRIGQAQTLEGASITSTNTDGLYSARLEEKLNNEILARESADINVEIEPEPIYLISKDSNNRAEIEIENNQLGDVAAANGGTLSCREGPTPTQSLAHPAILDWALTEYLTIASIGYKGLSLKNPFDDTIGKSILESARAKFNDDVHTLIMFQNVIASSPGSQRFVFATTDENPDEAIPLQHYNRCFITKDKTPGTYHLKAAVAKVITDAMIKKRAKEKERPQQHDPTAVGILTINGVNVPNLPPNKEAQVNKITGVEDSWYMLINNNDLYEMSDEEKNAILNSLDYDKYLSLLHDSYEKNWRNASPEWEAKEAEEKANAKKKTAHNLFEDVVTDVPADNNVKATTSEETTQEEAASDTPEETVVSEESSQDTPQTEEKEEFVVEFVMDDESTDTPDTTPAATAADDAIPDWLKMIQFNKTTISNTDIAKAEKKLAMNGIREVDTHKVLAEIIQILTNTDIDA